MFSEETEPGEGNPYNAKLADLSFNPNMTGAVVAAAQGNTRHYSYASNHDVSYMVAANGLVYAGGY